jgi:hypothetical protein
MFANAGFCAGNDEDLMPATDANPKGHWEHLGIWQTNEDILERMGGSWFDPPPIQAQIAGREWAVPLLRAVVQKITHDASATPIVIKDPRIGVMMPLWGPVLATRLHPVLVVRDPLEIALSLLARDGTPVPFGLAAWELHMTSLLSHLQDALVTVTPYNQLVNDTDLASGLIQACAAHIDPMLTRHLRPADASAAFNRGLYRNRTPEVAHRDHLTSSQLELWRLLSSLPAGDNSINVPPELRNPSNAVRVTVQAETRRLATNEDRASLTHSLARQQDQNQALREDLAAQRAKIDESDRALEAERARSNHLTGLLVGEQQRSASLFAELQAERDRVSTVSQSLAQAERWLASIQDSASWQITRPLRKIKRRVISQT